jgi:hypothetical protein
MWPVNAGEMAFVGSGDIKVSHLAFVVEVWNNN